MFQIKWVCIFLVGTVHGVKCWVCNSFADGSCGDPFDNHSFPITDCDAELGVRINLRLPNGKPIPSTMCRKIVQKGKFFHCSFFLSVFFCICFILALTVCILCS